MRTKDILKDNLPKTNIKSTLKFKWSFDDEIKKTIEVLWEFLDENLEKEYELDYVDIWIRSIKIKVNDDAKFIYRTLNIIFDYNQVDEKYWNTRIEITFNEVSQKPRFKIVWKFNIMDRDLINKSTLKNCIDWIEEIYD